MCITCDISEQNRRTALLDGFEDQASPNLEFYLSYSIASVAASDICKFPVTANVIFAIP